MYTAIQHLRVMEGVSFLRTELGAEAIDVAILSAGYELMHETQMIVPYEMTFNTMKGYEVDEWARFLRVHDRLEKAILGYDLVFMLLGDNYLRSLSLPIETQASQTLIFLTSRGSASYVHSLHANTFVLPLDNDSAKRYCYGLVGLKGFLFKRFAQAAALEPDSVKKNVPETGSLYSGR